MKEGGGVMEGWGARAHSPGLVIAHICSCVLAVVRRQLSCAQLSLFMCALSSFVCVCFHSWACVVVHGHSFPLVGMRPRLWAFVGASFHLWVAGFVHGCAFQCCGAPLGGWWILVAVRGVVVWWLVVCRLSLWVV